MSTLSAKQTMPELLHIHQPSQRDLIADQAGIATQSPGRNCDEGSPGNASFFDFLIQRGAAPKPLAAATTGYFLGTIVNSSISLLPAAAPSAQAQKDAMQRAFVKTGGDPKDVASLELHTTRTAKKNPTKANWVAGLFRREKDIVFGSVKGSMGHLGFAAFLSSLEKMPGTIPSNVNLNTPNLAVEWSKYNLQMPLEPKTEPTGRQSGTPALVPRNTRTIAFVFSGQDAQHFNSDGERSIPHLPAIRKSIIELDEVYASVVGRSLIESTGLFGDSADCPTDALGDSWPVAVALPALTMFQLALVDVLAVAGIRPDVVVGHSDGETAVLSASGAASKVVALKLAIARGRALSLFEDARGAMAEISCTSEQARSIISQVRAELGKGVLQIGGYNAPDALILSGHNAHVELAVSKATAACISARQLKRRISAHSSMMKLCRAEFVDRGLFDGSFDAEYYWDGIVEPVLFQDAIEEMLLRYEGVTFIEIGPHPVLTDHLRSMTEGMDNVTVTCPLRRAWNPQTAFETSEFLTALNLVAAAGHDCVDLDAIYGCGGPFRDSLPEHPVSDSPTTVPRIILPSEVVGSRQRHRIDPLDYSHMQANPKAHPELAAHVVKGEPVMSGSANANKLELWGSVTVQEPRTVEAVDVWGKKSSS
ncbi:acyl transferase/acyl hydrolase/lysophospholipase [Cerioporus squamosus]|nr:acyl transferase/acyl hydrolase/lysophospholipase [Cerioporus squamosus]